MRIDFKNCYYATFYDNDITISLHFNMKDKKQVKKYNKLRKYLKKKFYYARARVKK